MNSPLVFISYSHRDYKLMQELVRHLAILEHTGNIVLWVDERIDVGEVWYDAIEEAISKAKVALLLITADFLDSKFIAKEEIPRLLSRRASDGLVIIPIVAKDCLWQVVPWLRELNMPNHGRPIWTGPSSHRSRKLKEIAANVLDIVKNKVAPRGTLEPEMIQIKGGIFQMGANVDSKEQDVFIDENPLHSVDIPTYFISKFPITNRQYQRFIVDAKYRYPVDWLADTPPSEKLDHPVINVCWFDAVAYCRWLTENTGKYYRLPSEAEWEKAARGSKFQVFPWGNIWSPDRCNTKETGINGTSPVYQFNAGKSKYGVYDMGGNVSEWTISLWQNPETQIEYAYPYHADDGREIVDGDWELSQSLRENFTFRVLRGASFMFSKSFARCSFRRRLAPKNYGIDVGFRVAMTPL